MKVNIDRSKCDKNKSIEETVAKNHLISEDPFANAKLRLNGLEILSSLPVFFPPEKANLNKIKRRIQAGRNSPGKS